MEMCNYSARHLSVYILNYSGQLLSSDIWHYSTRQVNRWAQLQRRRQRDRNYLSVWRTEEQTHNNLFEFVHGPESDVTEEQTYHRHAQKGARVLPFVPDGVVGNTLLLEVDVTGHNTEMEDWWSGNFYETKFSWNSWTFSILTYQVRLESNLTRITRVG